MMVRRMAAKSAARTHRCCRGAGGAGWSCAHRATIGTAGAAGRRRSWHPRVRAGPHTRISCPSPRRPGWADAIKGYIEGVEGKGVIKEAVQAALADDTAVTATVNSIKEQLSNEWRKLAEQRVKHEVTTDPTIFQQQPSAREDLLHAPHRAALAEGYVARGLARLVELHHDGRTDAGRRRWAGRGDE